MSNCPCILSFSDSAYLYLVWRGDGPERGGMSLIFSLRTQLIRLVVICRFRGCNTSYPGTVYGLARFLILESSSGGHVSAINLINLHRVRHNQPKYLLVPSAVLCLLKFLKPVVWGRKVQESCRNHWKFRKPSFHCQYQITYLQASTSRHLIPGMFHSKYCIFFQIQHSIAF